MLEGGRQLLAHFAKGIEAPFKLMRVDDMGNIVILTHHIEIRMAEIKHFLPDTFMGPISKVRWFSDVYFSICFMTN